MKDELFDGGPPRPLVSTEAVKWICSTVVALAAIAGLATVCIFNPDLGSGIATGAGVILFAFIVGFFNS